MDMLTRDISKWALTAFCVIWIAVVGWRQFGEMSEGEVLNHTSQQIKEQMHDCKGSFKERYNCKEAITLHAGQFTFWNMLLHVAIVVVPPIAAGFAFSTLMPLPPTPPVFVSPLSRKTGEGVRIGKTNASIDDVTGVPGVPAGPTEPLGEDPDLWLEQARKGPQPPGSRR